MRIGLFVALTLVSAFPYALNAARADERRSARSCSRSLDAYVKDRASIEGLSGAALQVDRGAGKPILEVYAGDQWAQRQKADRR